MLSKWIPRIGWFKDGGPKSNVKGVFFEWKPVFSLALLRFKAPYRETFHSHAFTAWSVVLSGHLVEERLNKAMYTTQGYSLSTKIYHHTRGAFVYTPRELYHQVRPQRTTWVLSLRGPWTPTWHEIHCARGELTVTELGSGRTVISSRVLN